MSFREALKEVGIVDAKTNTEYFLKLKENGVTQEDIDRFAPEKFDKKDFWTVAAEIDNCSIVGGGLVPDNLDINEVNKYNGEYIKQLNIDYHVRGSKGIIDVGCGFGVLKQFVTHNKKYLGLDVVKRLDDAIEFNGYELPKNIDYAAYDMIVMHNVTQHMSLANIDVLLKQFNTYNITSLFISFTTTSWRYGHLRDRFLKNRDNDDRYTYTCGQLIKITDFETYQDMLINHGYYPQFYTNRCDGSIGVAAYLIKKKENV